MVVVQDTDNEETSFYKIMFPNSNFVFRVALVWECVRVLGGRVLKSLKLVNLTI